MTNLVIDIGNTYTKAAVFSNYRMLKIVQYKDVDANQLKEFAGKAAISKVIISSVKKTIDAWEGQLAESMPVVYFNQEMATGIHNKYRTPETLGLDRLAGLIGACSLFPAVNNLVIDAGTCITYDYVDADSNYYGGSISPGLNMRFKAMHNYTAGLPLINADNNYSGEYGNDTTSAITSGVQNGIKYELMGFIESYKKDQPQLNIILTGGDAIFFDTLLKNSIFAPYIKTEPYLVLKGLNAAIQKYND